GRRGGGETAWRGTVGEGWGDVLDAGNAGPAIAGNHVKGAPRRVRPSILNIRRQLDGVAFMQLRAVNVDFEQFQERSDARVVHRFRVGHGHLICPRFAPSEARPLTVFTPVGIAPYAPAATKIKSRPPRPWCRAPAPKRRRAR